MKKIYTLQQVAEMLQVDYHCVRRLIRGEQLEAFKVGVQWRITEDDLEKFIEDKKKENKWYEEELKQA